MNRRDLLKAGTGLAVAGAAMSGRGSAHEAHAPSAGEASSPPAPGGYTPVVSPNNVTLPYRMKDGVKEFHLVAEPVDKEFAPGMTVKCWGYNGRSPGPVIEAVEGDRVRILVTNRLPEHTTIHWHGLILPSGMDGVGGLNQPHIQPGETYAYEFPLRQHGTFLYHPHADEMLQMAVGMMGMFIIHPRRPERPRVDRDFAIMLHEWAIHPGTYRPDPAVMLDFNIFTMNGRVFPAIDPLVARKGDRVRIRFGNLSMHQHPMHLHGYVFAVTGTEGGPVPPSARFPVATAPVPVGSTRDIEVVADHPGDWALHCHKSHHTMNAMGHDIPNTLGVDQSRVEEKIRRMLPGFTAMGEGGMAEHTEHLEHLQGPENTLPMMMGQGPYGPIEMGGMFTVFKVREQLETYDHDPGWYRAPEGTVAYRVDADGKAVPPEPQDPDSETGDHQHHGHHGPSQHQRHGG